MNFDGNFRKFERELNTYEFRNDQEERSLKEYRGLQNNVIAANMLEDMVKHPIRPMKRYGVTKPEMIPISEIKLGIKVDFEVSDAVVVYLDILGFSEKKNDEKIEACLADFSAALILSARQNPNRDKIFFGNC
ncbi:MAG: hypothetical protein M0Q43_07995 [Methanothrix sp.]|jgi:hypothetical protein|nr:hypothetical protein [Methanothrix sp.]